MASSSRTLKIKFDGDSTGLAQASKSAGATLTKFNSTAQQTSSKLERTGKAAEDLGSNAGMATGAIGALGSGFELLGMDGVAQSFQRAALGADFLSGVGDSLDLAMNRLGISTLKAKAASVKATVATKAQTAATKAAAVAQRALNLVMKMNPIGLVIAAITLLVAAFVLAYKKSETFRKIVNGAFHAVKKVADVVFHAVTKFAKAAWHWINSNFPKIKHIITAPFEAGKRIVSKVFHAIQHAAGAVVGWIHGHWKLLLAILTGPFGLAVHEISKHWDQIKHGASAVKNWVTHKFNALVGFVKSLPGRITSAAHGMWDGISSAFRGVINTIIRWWNGLSFSLPSINTHIPGIGTVGGFTISTPNIGYLASGGLARAGRSYIVGENGPELLTMGNSTGYVTPNDQLGGDVEVRVFIGDQELRGLVQTEIRQTHRGMKRRALAGATA